MSQSTNSPRRSEKQANPPVHTIRYGTLRANIWKREVDLGNNSRPMYNVTFTRSYKDGNNWKDSPSFGPDDLLTLAKMADAAHTFIYGERSKDASGRQEAGGEELDTPTE